MTNFEAAFYLLFSLLIIGFMIGAVASVIAGAIHIGWKYAPVIVIIAFILFLLF